MVDVQVGLFLFNEPLLWMQYYAPATGLRVISTGMQLTFVALLAAFWLIEFGLLRVRASGKSPTCLRFYAPKLAAIFVYWLTTLAVYGYFVSQMTSDPMFDW